LLRNLLAVQQHQVIPVKVPATQHCSKRQTGPVFREPDNATAPGASSADAGNPKKNSREHEA
jgi:hypothetical protein